MLLLILIIVAFVFLTGGMGTRSHDLYSQYSTPSFGLGALLLIVVIVLVLSGTVSL